MRGIVSSVLFAGLLVAAVAPVSAAGVAISVGPTPPLIERGRLQHLNFDFQVKNELAKPVELRSITVTARGSDGSIISRRDIDGSGGAPAIAMVGPDRTIEPGATGLVFNPFAAFPLDAALDRLDYRFEFGVEGGDPIVSEVQVRPTAFVPPMPLRLPLGGRAWAKHGHDLASHHRRWNPLHPIAKMFGATSNFQRYASDLMIVDAAGGVRRNKTKGLDDFFGFGAPVVAPAAGRVVAVKDSEPDDDPVTGKTAFDPDRLKGEPLHFYGNYVAIDHGGSVSMLGHLQHGSAKVKVGDQVKAGQIVGAIGATGSAEFEPHLHYELRRGVGMATDGLPAYFCNLRRDGRVGATAPCAPIETGEIVEAR